MANFPSGMSNTALRRTFIYLTVILVASYSLYIFSGYGENHPIRTWMKNISSNTNNVQTPPPPPLPSSLPPSPPPKPAPPPSHVTVHPLTLGKAPEGQNHLLREDGLVEVNPLGRHPIFDLIEDAKEKWESKVAQQSKTFHEAVAEYQRRHGRLPPKGFDDWWAFVKRHDVQLPDEFDRIYQDLEPFWGIDPQVLNKIHKESEDDVRYRREFCVLTNERGKMNLKHSQDHSRMHELQDFLSDVVDYLPDFKIIIDVYDEPMKFIGYENRMELLNAAKAHKYVDPEHPAAASGWGGACPPDSPLRSGNPVNHTLKTFIYDHQIAMDPCHHPTLIEQNGFLTRETLHPLNANGHITPTFAISKTSLNTDILTVPLQGVMDEYHDDIPWEKKKDNRLMWRGSTTGTTFQRDLPWRQSQRVRLVTKATQKSGNVKVLLPPHGDSEPVGSPQSTEIEKLNSGYMDVYFANDPIQCWDNSFCNSLKSEFDFHLRQKEEEAWNYKYIMDIDGNGWSSRFKKLLESNSLIFKATVHPAWYSDRIVPWYHYVPVQYDLSDLYDTYLFFRGDLKGSQGHEDLARQIALQGQDWAKSHFRKRDEQAYMILLILEYSRLMSLDRESMTLDLKACTSRVCKSVGQ